MLRMGSRGIQVTELQSDLSRAGFSTGPADGVFGPKTEAAVKAFQRSKGLTPDGIAGPKTIAALVEAMYVQHRPAQDKQLSKNFNEKEFACRHCGKVRIIQEVVDKIQALRDRVGAPVTITSPYRCLTHNTNIGGAPQSRHMQGQALDIVVPASNRNEVARIAEQVGFGGIGVYEPSAKNGVWGFVHVDIGPHRRWKG